MNYFTKLFDNAYSKRQLFQYLSDSHRELRAGGSIFKNGNLFDRAYGLDLTVHQMYELGHWIASGEFLLYPEKFV